MIPLAEVLFEVRGMGLCEGGPTAELCKRASAVLDLLDSWEATRWRKDGRESEWTRLMIREVRDVLNGEREVGDVGLRIPPVGGTR